MPGFGILVPTLAGSTGVSPLKFLLLDAFGALAWASSHLLLGYLFRKNLETLASVCAKAGVLVAVSVFPVKPAQSRATSVRNRGKWIAEQKAQMDTVGRERCWPNWSGS